MIAIWLGKADFGSRGSKSNCRWDSQANGSADLTTDQHAMPILVAIDAAFDMVTALRSRKPLGYGLPKGK